MRRVGWSPEAWAAAAAALRQGEPLADACLRARLSPALIARLTAPSGGAWVEVLDGIEGARVLVADHAPGPVGARIAGQAAVVGFGESDAARAGFRRALLCDRPARLLIDAEARLAVGEDRWDLVIVDGLVAHRAGEGSALEARIRGLVAALAPEGRLVVLADSRMSPFRAADRAVRRPAGPSGPSLRAVERAVARTGFAVAKRFGLLRSSVDGVTAFDLDAPRATAAVLSAAAVKTGPVRTAGLEMIAKLAKEGKAAPFLPAWMIVACRPTSCWMAADRHPTGRLGYKHSTESKLLWGEPPRELEKRYSSPDGLAREVMALRTLEACGIGVVPRLLAQASDRTRQTWLSGRPLRPDLPSSEIRSWVARAARVLGEMQRATARDDGQVLVHGDYWLGNLLVEGGEVVGVLDWSGAHWGDAAEDLQHMVDSLVASRRVSPREGRVLREVAVRACRAAEPV